MKEYETFSNDVFSLEQQIKQAHTTGHDIQLHIHPWWYSAKFKDGRWDLDYNISSLAHLGFENASQYVSKCKKYLTQLLEKTGVEYSCKAFRAGAFSMMPTRVIHHALTSAGIEVDSSIFKWGKMDSINSNYDYTNAYSNIHPWYFSPHDVNLLDTDLGRHDQCLEMPIYSEYTSLMRFITWKRIALLKKIKSCLTKTSSPKISSGRHLYISNGRFLRGRRPMKFDFCKCTFYQMKKMIKNIAGYNRSHSYLPVVTIGHSKDFVYKKDLIKLLKLIHLSYKDIIEIVPLKKAVKTYKMTEMHGL
jgi:hypothetical protein